MLPNSNGGIGNSIEPWPASGRSITSSQFARHTERTACTWNRGIWLISFSAITNPSGMRGRSREVGSKSAANGTMATAARTRGSSARCGVASLKRQSITRRATQRLTPSRKPPRCKVMKPTQDEKSSFSWLSQWSRKRASDHTPPASDSVVWPPGHEERAGRPPAATPSVSGRCARPRHAGLALAGAYTAVVTGAVAAGSVMLADPVST